MKTAVGTFTRALAVRLVPGEDVFNGIVAACKEHGVKQGIIACGMGSLKDTRFLDVKMLPESKAGCGYGDPITPQGPMEIVSLAGMICHGENGDTLLHLHGTFSDEFGNAFGGHMTEGNIVLITADIVIAETGGMHFGRRYDDGFGLYLFDPTQSPPEK